MSVLYVGDTHGCLDAFRDVEKFAIERSIEHVVQVGDCGLSFSRGEQDSVFKFFLKRARQGRPGPTWWTPGGNHDNYDRWEKWAEAQGFPSVVELAPRFNWVRRGVTVELDDKIHLFMGGAESTDRQHRREGRDWWPQETPTYAEFNEFFHSLEITKPDVVVTHDAPLRVELFRESRDSQPTPRNLENALRVSAYTPPLWVFGHHHLTQEWDIEGTHFVCCGLNGQFWSPETGFLGRVHR